MDQQRQLQQKIVIKKEYLYSHLQIPSIMEDQSNKCIKIDQGKWKEFNLSTVCKFLKQWRVQNMLFLNKNFHRQILLDVLNISFPMLTQLYIANNLIQSVQCFSRLEAPLLEVIWIHDNLIVSIRSLRKANFPRLAYVRISQNMIVDSSQLDDLQILFPTSLYLEYNKFGNTQFEDLRPLAKFQFKDLDQQQLGLYAFSSRRIYQSKLVKCLSRKIPLFINFGFNHMFLPNNTDQPV